MDSTPIEASRRAEGTEALLVDMRAGNGIRGTAAWWDHTFVQLGGRTPTEALRAGDDDQVRALTANRRRVLTACVRTPTSRR
jgi:hypothetical protein